MKMPTTRSRALTTTSSSPTGLKSVLGWLGQKIRLTDTKFWATFFGGEVWAGEPVTPNAALQLSAVYRAVRLNAETAAATPLSLFEDDGSGPKKVTGSDTDTLIRVSPNQEQTPLEFWEQMIGCMELVGDGVGLKHKIGRRTVAVDVLDPTPGRMAIERNVQGSLEYRYTTDRGQLKIYGPADVLHLKGFGLLGPRGMSTVAYGTQGLSLARAAERVAGRLYKSGLRGAGIVTTAQVLNEPDRARLQKILDDYRNQEAGGAMMFLEGGMEWSSASMSAADAELLMTRKFQIEEIGRWFGMPPILLGHAVEGQTMWGSGVDSIIQAWLTLGLAQRYKRIELAITKRLMTPEERATLYPKYNQDALLRTNSQARALFLATMVQNGLLSRDEARELLERGKVPGGEIHTAQVNLAPLTQLGENSGTDSQVRAAFRSWLGIEDGPREPQDPAQHVH